MTKDKIQAPPVLASKPRLGVGDGKTSPATCHKTAPYQASDHYALFTATSTRSGLIAAYPELEQICTQIGFGSDKSLGEWSSELLADLMMLARAARAPPPTPTFDWSQAEIFELISEIIDHHHGPLRNELRRLGLLIRCIDQAPAEARVFDFHNAFAQLEINLIQHLDHEELTVFPHCLANESSCRGGVDGRAANGAVTTDIHDMMSGHEYGSAELSHLIGYVDVAVRTAANGDLEMIRLGLHAMAKDLLVHADKERDILMPAAVFTEDLLRSKQKHAAQPSARAPGHPEGTR